MKRTFALLAVFVLLTCLMLASLWLAGNHAPVRADEPEQPPLIPRHRTGHRAKVQNLDTLLAEGGDPLAGNHRLVEEEEIFLITKDSSGAVGWKYLDVDHDLGATKLINEHLLDGDSPALATGNFNGDNLEDFVAVRRRGTAVYLMLGYFRDGVTEVAYDFDTGENADGSPRVATGDFDGDGQDEIVVAWEGGSELLNLKVYDPVGSIHPVAEGKLYDEKVRHTVGPDVATGDFDGDGTDEVVLAWRGMDLHLNARVYDVDGDGNLTAKAKWTGSEGVWNAAVATGDLDGNGTDEVVVADDAQLATLQVTNSLATLTRKGSHDWDCSQFIAFDNIAVDVATGDFNTDGLDEIVSACRKVTTLTLDVWASGSTLDLVHKASWAKWLDDFGQNILAVGDLNHDLRPEIVLAWTVEEEFLGTVLDQLNYLRIFQVSTDLGTITAKSQRNLGKGAPSSHVALALGDLNGDSLQVGKPTYSRVTEAKQLLATINEPPKHLDTIDGTRYDVNVSEVGACPSSVGPPCTFATYENEQQEKTEMSMSVSRDWGFSSELGVHVGPIDTSLKLSYGEGFENTTSSLKEVSFGTKAAADLDDVIVRTETDYDVWEYPVYSDTTGTVEGYIAVVFPVKDVLTCTQDCAVRTSIAYLDGTDVNSHYVPNHENHNALSYSPDPPGDVGKSIKHGRFYLAESTFEFWTAWKDVEEDEQKQTRKQEVEFGAGVEAWGIKADVDGHYSKDQVSTQKVSFEEKTSLYVRLADIEPEYSYVVEPYVYWSADDGHLAVSYAAWPEVADSGGPKTWWQDIYDKPDPAFNLPWRYSETEGWPLWTKEITFDPHSPTAGELVTVTAKVRNYSLIPVGAVDVRFYQGDPDGKGKASQIGDDQTISAIAAQSSQTVTVQLNTAGYGGQTLDIYAVVDPDNEIAEVHDETSPPHGNNKAYALLPVKPDLTPGKPANLAIAPEDIVFQPQVPAPGETVHISTSIQAQGDTFTHVGVEFWDGDPWHGGNYVGGDYIPMILAGETAVARFAWDTTGQMGTHGIWVNVEHRARDEDLYSDNWARRSIYLTPHRQYLPLAFKDS